MPVAVNSLSAFCQKVGPLPLVAAYRDKLQLPGLLQSALQHAPYAQSIELLLKNILLHPLALYRLKEWGQGWDSRWM